MSLREAAQRLLEALERYQVKRQDFDRFADEITALRAALAEPVQEPYCYVYEYDAVFGLHREFYPRPYNGMKPSRTVPVYAHPPQRKPLVDPAEYDDAGAAERYNRGLK